MKPAVRRGSASGFTPGWNAILREGDGDMMDFDIVVQAPDTPLQWSDAKESVWVLLDGAATVQFAGEACTLQRTSLFDAAPSTLHLPPHLPLGVQPGGAGAEWAVLRGATAQAFTPRVFHPAEVATERRGAGLAQDACVRTVRCIFDTATRPESQFVVGEVVCDAGRWSSYPPHAHPQPEIYHYRFSEPQGYGHAELDDEVYKVFGHDTLCIAAGKTHAQVAAAGYGMWYLWVVRHLPEARYDGFTYRPEHTWLLDPRRQGWQPADRRRGTEDA